MDFESCYRTFAELERDLRERNRAVILLHPRLMRRLIRRIYRLNRTFYGLPHQHSLTIHRDFLRRLLRPSELSVPPADLPRTVMILERPSRRALRGRTKRRVLMESWQRLFHLAVHAELESPERRHQFTKSAVRARIDDIGQVAFDEVRDVLRAEHLVVSGCHAFKEYVEFAALFLELAAFDQSRIPSFFPSLEDPAAVQDILRRDVDAEALLAATCPHPELSLAASEAVRAGAGSEEAVPARRAIRPLRRAQRFRASRAASLKNHVGAAIAHQRAHGAAGDILDDRASEALGALSERLIGTGLFPDSVGEGLKLLLRDLLPMAASGYRTQEIRFLHDLQRVAVDHERGLSRFALFRFLWSFGRKPLKEPVPIQGRTMLLRHLSAAVRRLPRLRLEPQRAAWATDLLSQAVARAETSLREELRPSVDSCLPKGADGPDAFVERVSRHKLVEELLDRVLERGFTTLPDLRDAISRNGLKLGDVDGVSGFRSASELLSIDRALAEKLKGVHRPGEGYLRWLQRLSALAFGTKVGRFLTSYLALPFGGAFVLLEGLTHLLHAALGPFDIHVQLMDSRGFVLAAVGILLLLLMRWGSLRTALLSGLASVGGWIASAVALPRRWLALPAVRRLLRRKSVILTFRWVLRPAVPALLLWPLVHWMWGASLGPSATFLISFSFFVLLLLSPMGRLLEEQVEDTALRLWRGVRGTLIDGLLRFILNAFRRLLDALEGVVYGVDEWLRFRSGDGKLTSIMKAIGSSLWSVVTYFTRITINLFLEPQINPVKHFPVVTVSHKLLIPLQPLFASLLSPLGTVQSQTAATFVVTTLPGFFGFLVWELKENWRLFRANRATYLKPLPLGDHGETGIRLLHPGFHSGTLPKAFARLRKASGYEDAPARRRGVERELHRIHHVELVVTRFVERVLLQPLIQSSQWSGHDVHVAHVEASGHRLRILLTGESASEGELEIRIENQSGWLLASVANPSLLRKRSGTEIQMFERALLCFYAQLGVDLVREQIEKLISPESVPYDVADVGLLLWPGEDYGREVLYALDRRRILVPKEAGRATAEFPSIPRADLFLYENKVSYETWEHLFRTPLADSDKRGLLDSFRVLDLRTKKMPEH